jgi:hypothetical protein
LLDDWIESIVLISLSKRRFLTALNDHTTCPTFPDVYELADRDVDLRLNCDYLTPSAVEKGRMRSGTGSDRVTGCAKVTRASV